MNHEHNFKFKYCVTQIEHAFFMSRYQLKWRTYWIEDLAMLAEAFSLIKEFMGRQIC